MDDPLRILTRRLVLRRATTSGERAAAIWLVDQVGRQTHLVWMEPFNAFGSPRPARVLLLGLTLLGGMLAWLWPVGAVILTLLAALGFFAQALGWLELGWLFPCGESQNVVGVLPAAVEIRQRLVVVAHYDTGPRFWSRPFFLVLAAAMVALPFLTALAAVLPGWKGALLGPLAGIALGLIALGRGGPERGNAAGVAAALIVGQGNPLAYTEVWTLFTGSRIPGQLGTQAFLRRHGQLLAEAQFIVLEEAQRGGTSLGPLCGEAGMIRQLGYRLTALLRIGPDDLNSATARVRATAREIERRAGETAGNVVDYAHEHTRENTRPGPPGADD